MKNENMLMGHYELQWSLSFAPEVVTAQPVGLSNAVVGHFEEEQVTWREWCVSMSMLRTLGAN